MAASRSPFSRSARGRGSFQSTSPFTNPQCRAKKRRTKPKPRPAPLPIDDIEGLPAGQRVILPYPPIELSPNWSGHHMEKYKQQKAYKQVCWGLALEAGLKVPEYAGLDGFIFVRLDFFPPNLQSRDDDNCEASLKHGRDGVANAMRCDDRRFLVERELHKEPRSCVVLTLREDPSHKAAVEAQP